MVMEVKRIVVDELPECCRKCDLMLYSMSQEKYYCYVNKKIIYPTLRPSWCPLQVEDECVWTGEYSGWDENGDTIFFAKKTGCSDSHVQKVTVPNNVYCPNCGKRIKYVEE